MRNKIIPLLIAAGMLLSGLPVFADAPAGDWVVGYDDFSTLTAHDEVSVSDGVTFGGKLPELSALGWKFNKEEGDAAVKTEPGGFTLIKKASTTNSTTVTKSFLSEAGDPTKDFEYIFDVEFAYKDTATATSDHYGCISFPGLSAWQSSVEIRCKPNKFCVTGGNATTNSPADGTERAYTNGNRARVIIYMRKIGVLPPRQYKAYSVVIPDVSHPENRYLQSHNFRIQAALADGTIHGVPGKINVMVTKNMKNGDYVTLYKAAMYRALHTPSAANVKIANANGGDLIELGDTMELSYDFNQPEKAAEKGSVITWYRCDDENKTNPTVIKTGEYVPGISDSARTYTVQAEDGEKYIYAQVTPRRDSWDEADLEAEKLLNTSADFTDLKYEGEAKESNLLQVKLDSPNATIVSFQRSEPNPAEIAADTVVTDGYKLELQYRLGTAAEAADSLVEWYHEGVSTPLTSAAATADGKSVYTVTAADIGKQLYAKITPKKGALSGDAKTTVKTAVVTKNQKPEVRDAAIVLADGTAVSEEGVTTGTDLKAAYTYFDADGDLEDASAVSYIWEQASEENGSYTQAASGAAFTPGKLGYLRCKLSVQAESGALTSEEVITQAIKVSPSGDSPPSASNVTITGEALVGATLQAAYTYTDPFDLADQSVVEWYVSNDGALFEDIPFQRHTTSYTIPAAMSGMYIRVKVTPCNAFGMEGTAVTSPVIGPVRNASGIRGSGSSGGGSSRGTKTSISGAAMNQVLNQQPTVPVIQPTQPVTPPADSYYDDIGSVAWAADAIHAMKEKGIMTGVGDRQFAPERTVTREEIAKMLVEAFDISGQAEPQFTDLDDSSWSYPYFCAAIAKGIIQGYDDGSIGAAQPISRQDFAVVMVRTLTAQGITLQEEREGVGFADVEHIASYAAEAIDTLYRAGVINGKEDGQFDPKGSCTRAEAAAMLHAVLERQ